MNMDGWHHLWPAITHKDIADSMMLVVMLVFLLPQPIEPDALTLHTLIESSISASCIHHASSATKLIALMRSSAIGIHTTIAVVARCRQHLLQLCFHGMRLLIHGCQSLQLIVEDADSLPQRRRRVSNGRFSAFTMHTWRRYQNF